MIGKTNLIQSKDFKGGLYTGADIINPNPDISPNCMNVQWFFDNSIGKRYGSSTSNSAQITVGGGASGFIVGSTLTSGLQAYWKLDETSGNRSDVFGGNTLVDNNNVSSIVGIRNNAALFLASSSKSLVLANTAAIQTGNTPFSIAGWFYLNSTSSTVESTIVSKRDPSVDSYTVLLLHCDGVDGSTTFTDSSPSGKTVTAVGDAQIDTAQFKFGNASGLFDGTGDYLTVPDSTDWDFGTGDFTIDFWVRFNSIGNNMNFFDIGDFSLTGLGVQMRIDNAATTSITVTINSSSVINNVNLSQVLSNNTWYHIALARSGTTLKLFVDGVEKSSVSNSMDITGGSTAYIANSTIGGTSPLNGWIDEFRISKGVSRWTGNFTPPTAAYSPVAFEYWLYLNTNSLLTFSVSSSNLAATTSLIATSIGAISLNTWYNFVAWGQTAGGSTAAHIGLSVNQSANTGGYTSGLKIGSAPFVVGGLSNGIAGVATTFIDGRVDELGFWKKALNGQERADIYAGGSGNTYTSATESQSWYSFDFGASMSRWYTVCIGTGIVASSNLGTTFVAIATSRTANYQYLDRSKNVLICTSDSYDRTLYWAGSAGTFASNLAVNSAPQAKFSINYQGFLILLNSTDSNGAISNRRFSYADENFQLTSTWSDGFDLPSSSDDEITGPFILNKFLYISTKYKIFRLNYTGGNPDWEYIQVANFGFVPRTIKVFATKGQQVAMGLDWSRRMRVFYGYQSDIVSDNVENDNDYCEFAMQRISLAGSGLIVSNAEFDPNEQEYRLNVAIGSQSTQTTHAIVLNARTLAMYPYSNQPFNTMCIAESAGKQFLMAVDRSGYAHILNSGNLDVSTPINDVYDSPILFSKSPSEVTKNKQINFFFSHESSGTIYYQERFDFSRTYSPMKPLRNYAGEAELTGNEDKLQLIRSLDLPSVQNVYQFRLTSSAGTANPWTLNHFDLFNTPLGYGRGK